jgi:hypothetical protein
MSVELGKTRRQRKGCKYPITSSREWRCHPHPMQMVTRLHEGMGFHVLWVFTVPIPLARHHFVLSDCGLVPTSMTSEEEVGDRVQLEC